MEPKKIPPGVSPVRHIMSESDGRDFQPLKGFEEAKADPDGVAIFEADYGGQIMMTIRMKYVKCPEKHLNTLLEDLNNLYDWNDGGRGTGLYYERIPVGGGVTGGMGGGCVVDGVWAHPRFDEGHKVDLERLGQAVGDIIEGRADRLPEELRKEQKS